MAIVHVCPEMLVNNYKSKQHNIPKIVTNHSKKVAKLKNLGMTLPNQNCIEEHIKFWKFFLQSNTQSSSAFPLPKSEKLWKV